MAKTPELHIPIVPAEALSPLSPISIRDVRCDQLGFIKALGKYFDDRIKPRIKDRMNSQAAIRATGDAFEALLVTGNEVCTVDFEKFLKLYEAKKITRKQLVAASKVGRDAALDCLSREQLDAISESKPATPQLRISQIKTVEFTLVDAVKAVAAALDES